MLDVQPIHSTAQDMGKPCHGSGALADPSHAKILSPATHRPAAHQLPLAGHPLPPAAR
jgi:hypothetical protein